MGIADTAFVIGRAAGGVVVVAEVFSAERGAAAAMAVGEDVAAVEAFLCDWLLVCFVHGVPLPVKVLKYSKEKT